MIGLGTIINFAAVLIFGALGSLVKRGIPERISKTVMAAVSVAVIYVGIDGALEAPPAVKDGFFLSAGLVKFLVMLLSLAIGTLIGSLIDIDKWVNRLGVALEKKFSRDASGSFSKGFVSCTIMTCVGSMAINGAILDAVGKPDLLIAKAVIDAIACFVIASSLGIGCAFSAFPILIYQGAFTLLGLLFSAVIPAATITYLSVTGSLIIVLIGTNLLGVTNVKTANMIPAIFMPLIIAPIINLF